MRRPRLLLVPGISELEWQIRPELEEWADVATFDPAGVGAAPGEWSVEATVELALGVLDDRGWDEFVLVVDGWGPVYAAGILEKRPAEPRGIAIGHAAPSARMTGERAPLNGPVFDALANLIKKGEEAFAPFAISQFTRDGIDEKVAAEIVDRVPARVMETMIAAVRAADYDLVKTLGPFDVPLLLAKHEGCLAFTDEGYEDAVAVFPEARTVSTDKICSADPAFATALKEFCEEVYSAGTSSR